MCAPDKKSLLDSEPLESAMLIIEAHNRMYDPEPRAFDDEDEDDEDYRFADDEEYQDEYEEEYEGEHERVDEGRDASSRSSSPLSMNSDEIANAMLQANGDFLNQDTQLIDDVEDDEDEDDEDRAPVDHGTGRLSLLVMPPGGPFDARTAVLEDNLESYRQEARALWAEQIDEGDHDVNAATEPTSASRSRSYSPLDSDSDMDLMLRANEPLMMHRAGLIGVWRTDDRPEPGFGERVKNVLVRAVEIFRQKLAGLFGS